MRRWDAGESDRKLTLLTREWGVVDAYARGSRKGGSRLAGVTEPLTLATFQLASGKRFLYVTQAQAITSFPALRGEYEKLAIALALVELASAILPHEQPAEDSFQLLLEALRYVEVHAKPVAAFVWAEAALLGVAGTAPLFDRCVVCGKKASGSACSLSPWAGGYICSEHNSGYTDRFAASREVCIGLARIAELEIPPANLKCAGDCAKAIVAFARKLADQDLPAHRQLLAFLKSTSPASQDSNAPSE